MEKRDEVWCDINGKKYILQEIDDRYLLNILKFIARGGGYTDFLSEEKIKKLYNEATRRNIKHNLKLKDLLNEFYDKLNFVCQSECWWDYMD